MAVKGQFSEVANPYTFVIVVFQIPNNYSYVILKISIILSSKVGYSTRKPRRELPWPKKNLKVTNILWLRDLDITKIKGEVFGGL